MLGSWQPPLPATLAAEAASFASSPRRGEGIFWSKQGIVRIRAISGRNGSFASSYRDDPKEVAKPDTRKTNSLSDEDRAAAEELALLLGVSSDELIEEFENLSPEQEAELEDLLTRFDEAVPAMFASLDRMSHTLAETNATMGELRSMMVDTDQRLAKIEESIEGGALDFGDRASPAR